MRIENVENQSDETETKDGEIELPVTEEIKVVGENAESPEPKQIESDHLHSEHSDHSESKHHSDSDGSETKQSDRDQESKSPDSGCSERSQPILQPPASYQTLEQSSDNSDSSNNRTIESSQNNSFSDNSQIVPNTVDEQVINDDQQDDPMSDHVDEQFNEEINVHSVERDQNDNLPSPPTTPSDDTISSEPPKSCLSRRCSSKSSIKKKVNYSDSKEYIPSVDDGLLPMVTDDDEVFSDSISPQLPRGDMCTPYPKKKGSIPGLTFPSDWFPDDR